MGRNRERICWISQVSPPYSFCQCYGCNSLVNQTTPTIALDVLVMQYVQRCGGSGMVYETMLAKGGHNGGILRYVHCMISSWETDVFFLIVSGMAAPEGLEHEQLFKDVIDLVKEYLLKYNARSSKVGSILVMYVHVIKCIIVVYV